MKLAILKCHPSNDFHLRAEPRLLHLTNAEYRTKRHEIKAGSRIGHLNPLVFVKNRNTEIIFIK